MLGWFKLWRLRILLRIGSQDAKRNALRGLYMLGTPRAQASMIRVALRDPDEKVRASAVGWLEIFEEIQILQALFTGGLEQRHPETWQKACRQLIAKGHQEILPRLVDVALDDAEPSYRVFAASILSHVNDRTTLERLLLEGRKKERPEAWQPAACALGRLGDPRATEALLEMLDDEGHALYAAQVLAEQGDARAMPTIVRLHLYRAGVEMLEKNAQAVSDEFLRVLASVADVTHTETQEALYNDMEPGSRSEMLSWETPHTTSSDWIRDPAIEELSRRGLSSNVQPDSAQSR